MKITIERSEKSVKIFEDGSQVSELDITVDFPFLNYGGQWNKLPPSVLRGTDTVLLDWLNDFMPRVKFANQHNKSIPS